MAKYTLPSDKGHNMLLHMIKDAIDGDEIVCRNADQASFGEHTRQRLYPAKKITFTVDEKAGENIGMTYDLYGRPERIMYPIINKFPPQRIPRKKG